MLNTRVSLLERVRTQDDARSWKELDDLYRPFILRLLMAFQIAIRRQLSMAAGFGRHITARGSAISASRFCE